MADSAKAKYVRKQGQTRAHHCHWPGCEAQVPPAMWGCKAHWFSLPRKLRDRIWTTYRPGQEVRGTPSADYLDAAAEVQRWIREFQASQRGQGSQPMRPREGSEPKAETERLGAEPAEPGHEVTRPEETAAQPAEGQKP